MRTNWYDPKANVATFVVLVPSPPGFRRYPTIGSVRETFGQPLRIYYVGSYTVLVWNKNLLAQLGAEEPLPVNPGNPAPATPTPGPPVRPIPGPGGP